MPGIGGAVARDGHDSVTTARADRRAAKAGLAGPGAGALGAVGGDAAAGGPACRRRCPRWPFWSTRPPQAPAQAAAVETLLAVLAQLEARTGLRPGGWTGPGV